jgi:hypothetical protein
MNKIAAGIGFHKERLQNVSHVLACAVAPTLNKSDHRRALFIGGYMGKADKHCFESRIHTHEQVYIRAHIRVHCYRNCQ